jgi:succinoglycan biosynthesis protein ExoA
MIDGSLVSVLIPARNEARDIGACLDAVLAQDQPRERLEVVVVDGGSSDDTAAIARQVLSAADVAHQVIDNPVGTTPSNLNAGLACVHGEVVCRVDARSIIPTHYVRRCAEVLATRPDVAVVGGAQIAVARDASDRAIGIARALNNRWGMGGARYRRGATDGPSDTVYLGAFRTTELRDAGGWDERFTTNQDYELNRRMGERGLVWFDASLEVGYRPRATLGELGEQYRRFGAWKARYWRQTSDRPQPRQLALLGVLPVGVMAAIAFPMLPPRGQLALAAAAGAGAVAFELKGSPGPQGSVRAHAISLAASAAVGAGWSTGAWSALLRPESTPSS